MMTASAMERDGVPAQDAGRRNGAQNNPVVDRMVGAARFWLRQRATLRGRVSVTMLSPDEHVALKARMFAAVADDVAHHPDLDRAIAYLQALGKLANADDENPADKAG
ncbi:MAG: hypothetical protein ABL897_08085 [Hyphomicrobium sp.]